MYGYLETVFDVIKSENTNDNLKIIKIEDKFHETLLGLFSPSNIPEEFKNLTVDNYDRITLQYLVIYVYRPFPEDLGVAKSFDIIDDGDLQEYKIITLKRIFYNLRKSIDGICNKNFKTQCALDCLNEAEDWAISSAEGTDEDEQWA